MNSPSFPLCIHNRPKRKTLIYQWIMSNLADKGPLYSHKVSDVLSLTNEEVMNCAEMINSVFPGCLQLSRTFVDGPLIATELGWKAILMYICNHEKNCHGVRLEEFYQLLSREFFIVALASRWVKLQQIDAQLYVLPGQKKLQFYFALTCLVNLLLGSYITDCSKEILSSHGLAISTSKISVYFIEKGLSFPEDRNQVSRIWLWMMRNCQRTQPPKPICCQAPTNCSSTSLHTISALLPDST